MKIHISNQDKLLVLAIAIMGFIFSSREWLLPLKTLNPFSGLILYYIVLFFSLLALSHAGLIINQIKISNSRQVIGLLMVTFAFFVVVNWTNQYVQWVSEGTLNGASALFYQCEDGAVFYLWTQIISPIPANMELLRILSFVITPAIIALLGVALVKGGIEIG